ncbi:hypothetical protein ACS0TY_017772 [Phlomoides rotata]
MVLGCVGMHLEFPISLLQTIVFFSVGLLRMNVSLFADCCISMKWCLAKPLITVNQ